MDLVRVEGYRWTLSERCSKAEGSMDIVRKIFYWAEEKDGVSQRHAPGLRGVIGT